VVGVRELRARLSAYLRAVSRGAEVMIGDRRRRPIARLAPVSRSADDEVLHRLASQGVVRRGQGKPGGGRRLRSRVPGRLVSDIVVEDRG
jgi:antitoxin (DNA-binding transcriptional repressor) of toxin-antitoxin stability system